MMPSQMNATPRPRKRFVSSLFASRFAPSHFINGSFSLYSSPLVFRGRSWGWRGAAFGALSSADSMDSMDAVIYEKHRDLSASDWDLFRTRSMSFLEYLLGRIADKDPTSEELENGVREQRESNPDRTFFFSLFSFSHSCFFFFSLCFTHVVKSSVERPFRAATGVV